MTKFEAGKSYTARDYRFGNFYTLNVVARTAKTVTFENKLFKATRRILTVNGIDGTTFEKAALFSKRDDCWLCATNCAN